MMMLALRLPATAVRRGIRSNRCHPTITSANLSSADNVTPQSPNSQHRSFATRRRQRVTKRSSRFDPPPPLSTAGPSDHELARGAPQQPSAPSNVPSDEQIRSQSSDLLQNASVRPNTQTTHGVSSSSSADNEPYDPGMPMDAYLRMASLSPWVPCPDVVARRMLDVAQADDATVHYDLGCGDGRVNFHALDTYAVRHTTGIDIDPSMVRRADDRLGRRHPRPANVEFVAADLLDDAQASDLWTRMGSSDSSPGDTVITCYFVEEALQKIRPLLERHCGGSRSRRQDGGRIRVVTCGYEMRGWDAKWSEVVLGLPIFLYELRGGDGDEEGEEDVPPPSIEDLKAAAMADSDNEVIEAAARAAEVDGGGWKSGAAEDQYSEPETFDYMFDPNERVNGGWDTFDEADELMRQQEEEEEAKAEEAEAEAERSNRKTTKK